MVATVPVNNCINSSSSMPADVWEECKFPERPSALFFVCSELLIVLLSTMCVCVYVCVFSHLLPITGCSSSTRETLPLKHSWPTAASIRPFRRTCLHLLCRLLCSTSFGFCSCPWICELPSYVECVCCD